MSTPPLNIPSGFSLVGVEHIPLGITGSHPTFTFGCASDDLSTVGETVGTWLTDHYAPGLSEGWSIAGITITTSVGTSTFSRSITGGLSGAPLPPNVAFIVHKRTSTAGVHGRGRMYWGAMAPKTAVDDDGNVDDTFIGDIQNIADNLIGSMAGADAALQLFHRSSLSPTPITALEVEGMVATVRRRLRK